MGLEMAIAGAKALAAGLWTANLSPGDVQRLGDSKLNVGRRSVIGVSGATYESGTRRLLIEPAQTTVFNIGSTDEVFVVDLGHLSHTQQDIAGTKSQSTAAISNGDAQFISTCEREHLPIHLVEAAQKIIGAVRAKYPGQMKEGKARKWVNYPDNFLAMVIQPRGQSFAVHIWGRPNRFQASSLDIKPDRSRYSRFKLAKKSQIDDALRVVIESARLATGR